MGFVTWVAAGLVVGIVAKLSKGFGDTGDWLVCLFLGAAAGAVGGFIYALYSWGALRTIRPGSIVVAVVVAAIVLVGYRVASREPRWS